MGAVCGSAVPRSRFQTLSRVGISTGSRNRIAAVHQSAGKSLQGR